MRSKKGRSDRHARLDDDPHQILDGFSFLGNAHAVFVLGGVSRLRGAICSLEVDADLPATPADRGASMTFASDFLAETSAILEALDRDAIERAAQALADVRGRGGRLFILGVGGSAGHASHAVNDFRKLCGFEAYSPTDNVSELTARTNDEGWETTFSAWLVGSRLCERDGILVFSVGGGDAERNVSMNIVSAIDLSRDRGATVVGVVGRDGGHTARSADVCVVIPPLFNDRVTPHTEGLCAVIWHLLVSHPLLSTAQTKWESMSAPT